MAYYMVAFVVILTHNTVLRVSNRIVKIEVGSRFFVGGGLREEVGGSKFCVDTELKKRWGSNFVINYRRKR